MRNRLLATVALAAVVGFGGFAAAQSQADCKSNVPPGTTSGTSAEERRAVSADQHSTIKVAVARGSSPRVDRRELHSASPSGVRFRGTCPLSRCLMRSCKSFRSIAASIIHHIVPH